MNQTTKLPPGERDDDLNYLSSNNNASHAVTVMDGIASNIAAALYKVGSRYDTHGKVETRDMQIAVTHSDKGETGRGIHDADERKGSAGSNSVVKNTSGSIHD